MAGTIKDLLLQAHKRQQDAPPPKKRKKLNPNEPISVSNASKKTANGPARKRSAKLSKLPELPVDILHEIFGHLLPLDLLHLARTNKSLRNLIMRKSATSTWISSFSNVNDIGCPNDVSHPIWASLVWDKDCHNCGSLNSRTMNFCLRIRLCGRCAKARLLDVDRWSDESERELIRQCVPCAEWGNTEREVCIRSEVNTFFRCLHGFAEESEEQKAQFIRQKREELEKRTDRAMQWESWANDLYNERQRELDVIRDERSISLRRKLEAEGYKTELDRLDELCSTAPYTYFPLWYDHPIVKQPKPLTERNWNQIKQEMISYMETVKADRLREERRILIWERRHKATDAWIMYRDEHHPLGTFLPNPIDIWFYPPIKERIESPSDSCVGFSYITKPFTSLASFVTQWQGEKMGELVRLLPSKVGHTGPEALKLATSVFACQRGSFHDQFSKVSWPENHHPCMWFPEFLHHPCNALDKLAETWHGGEDDEYDEHDPDDDEATRIDRDVHQGPSLRVNAEFPGRGWRRRQWSTKWLAFDHKASRTVRNILDACTLNHMTTVMELDEEDPRVVCLKCTYGAKPDGERRFPVLTWRNAVQHSIKKHWGDSGVSWQMLSPEDAARARELEHAECERRGHNKQAQRRWRCGTCRDTWEDRGAMSVEDMADHHDYHHYGSEELEVGVHYYAALDMPPRQGPIVQMIPHAVCQ